ncbi:MAG: WD40 repeat domain-containing protein [Acetobacter sp.]|nr:WD40 repeat domain-containing protein [Acetobacter sp.]
MITRHNLAALVQTRGAQQQTESEITACIATRDSSRFVFATALGEIITILRATLRTPEQWKTTPIHDGPILALSMDTQSQSVLTGGDDGRLCRLTPSYTVEELGKIRRWVEHITSFTGKEKQTDLIAVASSKQVELREATGKTILRTLEHSSAVGGIVFDPHGKYLAVSHYNGVSLWTTQSHTNTDTNADTPRFLEWKGSHLSIAIHPQGKSVVTAMQENDLHGWRLSDGHNMRMSGYPAKVRSLSFSHNGEWLATSGAPVVVVWPFHGDDGPIGKPPIELPGIDNTLLCTQVAFHPTQEVLAAGFENGMVLLFELSTQRVLPVSLDTIGSVTALTYSPDGCLLGYGTENGNIGIIDLTATH